MDGKATRRDHMALTLGFVVRPSVVIGMVYVWHVAWLLLLALTTTKFPHPLGDAPARFISGGQLAAVTCINGVLLIALCIDALAIRHDPPYARRGPLVGIVICAVSVVLLQVGAVTAHAPLEWVR